MRFLHVVLSHTSRFRLYDFLSRNTSSRPPTTTSPSTNKISKVEKGSMYLDMLILHVQSFEVALHVPR